MTEPVKPTLPVVKDDPTPSVSTPGAPDDIPDLGPVIDWSMSPTAVAAGHVPSVKFSGPVPAEEYPPSDPVKTPAATPGDWPVAVHGEDSADTADEFPEEHYTNFSGTPVPDDIGNHETADQNALVKQILSDLVQSGGLIRSQDGQDLEDFKKQVIAAFKHSGLDTRKFFGV